MIFLKSKMEIAFFHFFKYYLLIFLADVLLLQHSTNQFGIVILQLFVQLLKTVKLNMAI